MNHPFMENMAEYLADVNIGTFRFNFPYMENHSKRPDPPLVLIKTIQSALWKLREFTGNIPVLAGGKSMGGRMISLAASKNLLGGITGIVFLGFPLHAPAKPSDDRAEHLYAIQTPMLFLQGTNDKLANLSLLTPVITRLGSIASLHILQNADHSFKLPKKTGRNEEDVYKELSTKIKEWALISKNP
jgi:predicted alpha/beta-hydrolase family hydrolase